MFSIIACIGKNRELGRQGKLIFHLKDDLNFFKDTTTDHPVVMGRKTWESLPSKLKNRKNIVISRSDFSGPDRVIHDLDQFIAENQDTPEEIFVIGGGEIYQKFLPFAKTLYLTEVDASAPDADTFFPDFDPERYTSDIIKQRKEDGLAYQIVKYIKN